MAMSSVGLALVRRKDFRIVMDLGLNDTSITDEFSNAVMEIKTSHLNNIVMLQVSHPVDGLVHQTIEYMCVRGVVRMEYHLLHPTRDDLNPRAAGPVSREYMAGTVIEQWSDNSNYEDGEEPMLDLLRIEFDHKTTTKRRWVSKAEARSNFSIVDNLNPISRHT